jgi:hypothetical protein
MPVAPIQEGGRYAVVVPKCPIETHYLLMPVAPIQKGGRFAAVVPNSLKETLLIIYKGGQGVRFAAVLSSIPQLPNSKGRPLRGPSCGSQLSKRDPLICLQKGGRFALRARSCCYMLPTKRRARSCCYL